MKKILISVIMLISILTVFETKAYAYAPIYPINNLYKEGIYRLDPNEAGKYELKYELPSKGGNSKIFILDENFNIKHESSTCEGRCSAGSITNKDRIVIVGENGVSLFFY